VSGDPKLIAAVQRGFTALSDGDVDAMLANATDDFVLELPYADPPKRFEGKAAAREFLREALATFELDLRVTGAYLCTDGTIIAEYVSTGRAVPTGKAYANTYIAVLQFRDGKLCLQREYYNPVLSDRALAPD
jgi:uncharacterized protein